jgi:ketosteroid isomerase-like protein
MEAKISKLINESEIIQVINSYFQALDEKKFDIASMEEVFAPDAQVFRPNGILTTGPEEIGQSHLKSFARFKSSQHLPSGYIISFHSDGTAEVRVNLVAIHLWNSDDPKDQSYFAAGGVLTAKIIHMQNGWRIQKLENRIVWRHGSGFEKMLKMEK